MESLGNRPSEGVKPSYFFAFADAKTVSGKRRENAWQISPMVEKPNHRATQFTEVEIKTNTNASKNMKLLMENPNTGIIKTIPTGFSWTTLFFSGFPALFRGDMKWFFIQLLLCWTGVSFIIFAFIYNKIYIRKLLERGFKVKDVEGGTLEDARTKLSINLPKFEAKAN